MQINSNQFLPKMNKFIFYSSIIWYFARSFIIISMALSNQVPENIPICDFKILMVPVITIFGLFIFLFFSKLVIHAKLLCAVVISERMIILMVTSAIFPGLISFNRYIAEAMLSAIGLIIIIKILIEFRKKNFYIFKDFEKYQNLLNSNTKKI